MKTNQNQTPLTDRQKVEAFLNHINEQCPITRAEVLKQCAEDIEARKYYVKRWLEDVGAVQT